MSGAGSVMLSGPELAKVLRMVRRELKTIIHELASSYSQHLVASLATVLDNAALSAEATCGCGAKVASIEGVIEAARKEKAEVEKITQREEKRLASLEKPVTSNQLNAYFASVDELKDKKVTSITQLPGGFSKATFLIETHSAPNLILRRDLPFYVSPCSAADEFEYLRALSAEGLQVARPIVASRDSGILGYPFLITECAPGVNAGVLAKENSDAGRNVALQLAAMLGQLHAMDPAAVGMQSELEPEAYMRQYIASWQVLWRSSGGPSCWFVEKALEWLDENVPEDIEQLVLIHGDARPDNMLADHNGNNCVLLDWEFLHAGDPVEDLQYAWQFVEPLIDSASFYESYLQAGGRPHSDKRGNYYRVWRNVRNLICLDLSWAAFSKGDCPSYLAGAPRLLFRRMLREDLGKQMMSLGIS